MTPNPNPSPELREAIDGWFLADQDIRGRWQIRHRKHVEYVEGGDRDEAYERLQELRWAAVLAALSPQTLPAPGEVEIVGWLEAEQKRLDDEAGDYLMDTSDCIKVIREKFATLATVAAANDEGVAEALDRQVRIAAWNAAKKSGASDALGYAVVEAVVAEFAAIRLLPQGGGKA